MKQFQKDAIHAVYQARDTIIIQPKACGKKHLLSDSGFIRRTGHHSGDLPHHIIDKLTRGESEAPWN